MGLIHVRWVKKLPQLPILGSEREDFLEEKKVTLVTEILSIIYLLSQGLAKKPRLASNLRSFYFCLLVVGITLQTAHVLNLNSVFVTQVCPNKSREKHQAEC